MANQERADLIRERIWKKGFSGADTHHRQIFKLRDVGRWVNVIAGQSVMRKRRLNTETLTRPAIYDACQMGLRLY